MVIIFVESFDERSFFDKIIDSEIHSVMYFEKYVPLMYLKNYLESSAFLDPINY